MEFFDKHSHWENIYKTKALTEVSWFQPEPVTSLEFIAGFNLPPAAKIIDIGGGDSFLVDYLLDAGFSDITVLDISETSIERAKQRLGNRAAQVKWIVSDITAFEPVEKYDLWHDRAAFHFLTTDNEIAAYLNVIQKGIAPAGIAVIGTFSEEGPKKCSGIAIKQYSEITLTVLLQPFFDKLKCITVDHPTPFETTQNFVFCSFRRKHPEGN